MIVVCGEVLVDLVPAPSPGGQPGTTVSLTGHPGGSPANVAVGLARLDQPVALLARLSAGGLGPLLRTHLESNGVDLSLAVAAAEPPTLALVSLDAAGVASYDFYVQGTADFAWTDAELATLPAGTQALHTGSLALSVPPAGHPLETLLRRERGRRVLSFDPNVRPKLIADMDAYRRRLADWVRLVDIVKISDEDVAAVFPGVPTEDVLATWTTAGPALVVLTRGADGVVVLTSDGRRIARPAPAVHVVDTVGAGDAFTAGLLDGLARQDVLTGAGLRSASGQALAAAAEWALQVASVTCTRAGADPPRRRELPGGS